MIFCHRRQIHSETTKYCIHICADGGQTRLIEGQTAMRRVLDQAFYGSGKLTGQDAVDSQDRWERFCNEDEWGYNNEEPACWSEKGEDYSVSVFLMKSFDVITSSSGGLEYDKVTVQ